MPYAYGFCPNCGVKFNIRESSVGTARRCEWCGAKFIIQAPPPPPLSAIGGTCLVVMLTALCGLVVVVAACAGLAMLGSKSDRPRPHAPEPKVDDAQVSKSDARPAAVTEPVEEAVVRGDESINSKAPPPKAEAEVRTWRDSSGEFHTEAQFVSMTAGVVTLRKTDGTTVKVPVERLSEEDRKWIEVRRKKRRP